MRQVLPPSYEFQFAGDYGVVGMVLCVAMPGCQTWLHFPPGRPRSITRFSGSIVARQAAGLNRTNASATRVFGSKASTDVSRVLGRFLFWVKPVFALRTPPWDRGAFSKATTSVASASSTRRQRCPARATAGVTADVPRSRLDDKKRPVEFAPSEPNGQISCGSPADCGINGEHPRFRLQSAMMWGR